jgi:excisionase family DNA binding protein
MSELQLFPLAEAAKSLGISHWTIRAHIRRGTIAVVRFGRRILISREEVERIGREGLPSLPRNTSN